MEAGERLCLAPTKKRNREEQGGTASKAHAESEPLPPRGSWMLWIIFYTSDTRRASNAADQASGHLSKQRLQHRPTNEPRLDPPHGKPLYLPQPGWSWATFSVTCSHTSRYKSPIIASDE